jgi:hypothetical protein
MKRLAVLILFLVGGVCSAQTTVIGYSQAAATPTFNPAAGSIASGTTVAISTATSGCSAYIYWNFTGTSMASGTNSTTSSGITVTSTLYAQVIGCPGYLNSAIGSAAYTVTGILTPAVIQMARVSGGSSKAFPFNVQGSGTILLVAMRSGSGINRTLTATDSQGNSFTTLKSVNLATDGDTAALACAPSGTAGADTVTFKDNGVTTTMAVSLYEVKNATCTQDATATSSNTTGATACGTATLTITTVTNNDFVAQLCATKGINGTWIPAAGWYRQNGSFDTQNGSIDLSSQALYTAGTVTAGDTFGATDEQGTILVALKAATGTAPTTPSVDANSNSGNILVAGNQTSSMTVSASAEFMTVDTFMDTGSVSVTEVCEYPSSGTYSTCAAAGGNIGTFLGRGIQGAANTVERWTFVAGTNLLTGSVKIRVTWGTTTDLTSMAAASWTGGSGFASFGNASNTSGNSSATITSATGHLVIDGVLVSQNSTCGTNPTAGAGQTFVYGPLCNGSGNWFYMGSSAAGGSSVTMTETNPTNIGWVQDVSDMD